MPDGPEGDTAQDDKDGLSFDTFSGLRNTVKPERMGPRELTQATNVDIDDVGELRRRKGYRKAMIGQFHSLYQVNSQLALVVKNGTLCFLYPNYTTFPLLVGISAEPLSYERIKDTVYCSSATNSCKVSLRSGQVLPWGAIYDHNWQPGLDPAPGEWWYSPVSDPEQAAGLGPIAGQLLAPPPPAAFITYFNGRIYLASGSVLWATELYRYDWIDKQAGFRQYEDQITGLCAVEDGIYVGTLAGLYFVQGMFGEEKRTLKEEGSVVPGTMITVPGELFTPEGRRRPDIPEQNAKAMSCMMDVGQVIGMPDGATFNMTRTHFKFPIAAYGSSLFRDQAGIAQFITTLDTGGNAYNNDGALFGDRCDVTVTRWRD